jgi:hypothetical protein
MFLQRSQQATKNLHLLETTECRSFGPIKYDRASVERRAITLLFSVRAWRRDVHVYGWAGRPIPTQDDGIRSVFPQPMNAIRPDGQTEKMSRESRPSATSQNIFSCR